MTPTLSLRQNPTLSRWPPYVKVLEPAVVREEMRQALEEAFRLHME